MPQSAADIRSFEAKRAWVAVIDGWVVVQTIRFVAFFSFLSSSIFLGYNTVIKKYHVNSGE
jgi:hypothetical protein